MRRLLAILLLLSAIDSPGQNTIRSYEYWFNANYAGRQQQSVTPSAQYTLNTGISATVLPDGLHVFNLRFKDDSARYSSTISQFFYKHTGGVTGAANINGYQYWFDNNFAAAVMVPTALTGTFNLNAPINAAALSSGLHLFHIRFSDNTSQWSSTVSQFFYKSEPTTTPGSNLINTYQYWFDNDFANVSNVAVAAAGEVQLSAAISTSNLSQGLHLLHLRFKDQRSQWSSTISQFVYTSKTAAVVTTNAMSNMQYWFDNNYAGAISKALAVQPVVQVTDMLDAGTLPDGLHILNIRFADTVGQWSSTISQFFYKSAEVGVTTNVITGYRYWFNDDAANMAFHSTPAQNPYVLNTTLDMGCATAGANRLHIQFLDKTGLWSTPLTDTVTVTPPLNNVYRFTGNGNWSNAANWQNNAKPALDLPWCKEVIIDHAVGGICILDIPQYLLKSAKLTVLPGKKLVIPQNMELK